MFDIWTDIILNIQVSYGLAPSVKLTFECEDKQVAGFPGCFKSIVSDRGDAIDQANNWTEVWFHRLEGKGCSVYTIG